jgi:hypothetical protein
MAGNSIGSLIVSLGLDAAEFISGMTKSEKEAQALAARIDRGLQKAAAGAGVALGVMAVAATAAYVEIGKLVDSAANFKDLEEQTGASAEALASLAIAAQVGGVDMETVAGAANKLTKNLVGVDDESSAAGAALKALGLNVKTFKELDPATQFEQLGKALDGFRDGAQKTAVAQAVLGKSGAQLLPFLKELTAEGGRTVTLTQQQIELADEYADKQAKLAATVKAYAQSLAVDALPSVIDFKQALADTLLALIGVDTTSTKIGSNTAIKDFADGAAEALGFVVDQIDLVARLFELAGKSIGGYAATAAALLRGNLDEARAVGQATREAIDEVIARQTFGDRLAKQISARRIAEANAASYSNEGRQPTKTVLDFNGADDGKVAAKAFENQMKALDRALKDESDLLAARNRMLDTFNSQNLLSIKDYYDGRRVAAEEALKAQVSIYDREIAAARAFQATQGKAEDRTATQGKIDDLREKRADAIQKAGLEGLDLTIKQKAAEEELQRSFDATLASVYELTGQLEKAAAIRFDAANEGLRKRFSAEDEQAGLAALDVLRERSLQQARFNEAVQQSDQVLARLQGTEASVQLAQEAGTKTALQGLIDVGRARQEAVTQLEAIVAAEEAVAKASESPALIAQAEKSRLALEQLRAQVDPLANAINDSLGNALGKTLEGIENGSLSAADAFRSFANSVISDILRIAQQDLIRSLFGSGGSAAGIGSYFSGFFGSGSGTGFGTGSNFGNQDYGAFLAEGTNYVPYDGFRATLHKGEAVQPAKYNPAAGGQQGGGNVVVENHGAQVSTKRDPNGDTRVLINAMKSELLDDLASGGSLARGVASTFGLRRDLARRGT